jgi:type I restriction enzyme S subunit
LKEADEWAVLKVGCVNGWSFNEDQHKVLPRHLEPRSHLEIKDGDVLMSRANTRDLVGSVAIVRNPPRRLLLCDKLYRLKFDTRKIEPRYAVIALRSDVSRNHYEMNSNGASASMQNIGQETVRTLTLSLPEIERQVELADRFEEAAQNTTALTTAIQRTLQGLAEHRAALITAAVTGQIDVATWDKRGESDRRLDVLQEGMGA